MLAPLAVASDDFRNQLIVQYKPSTSTSERIEARGRADVSLERKMLLPRTELVTVEEGTTADALQALAASSEIASVERNRKVTKATLSDPLFSQQWSMLDYRVPIGPRYWGGDPINVEAGWTSGGKGEGRLIAIIDTGVDFSHEDLVDRQYTNPGEVGTDNLDRDKRTNGLDDDGNGFVDDWRGWDFVGDDNAPDDLDGHGTHVAGTAAATADNGKGVVGVAPEADVVSVRVLDANGDGTFADVADAFVYAGLLGADVANASLGATFAIRTSSEREYEGFSFLVDAVDTAPETTFVVAAGNENAYLDWIPGTIDTYTSLPCEMTLNNIRPDNVVCVGTVDISWYSNWGSKVDVTAPGTAILSTKMGGGYEKLTGTSMATPHVAGALAIAGEFFEETPRQQRNRLYTLGRGSFCGDVDPTSQWWLNQPKNCVGLYGPIREVCPVRDGTQCPARPLNLGGMLDRDVDGDQVSALWDNCPLVANSVYEPGTNEKSRTQYDADRDGVGNECDPDYQAPTPEPEPQPTPQPPTPPTTPPGETTPAPSPGSQTPVTPSPPQIPAPSPEPIDSREATLIRMGRKDLRSAFARGQLRLVGRLGPMAGRSKSASRILAALTVSRSGRSVLMRGTARAESRTGKFVIRFPRARLRGASPRGVVLRTVGDDLHSPGLLQVKLPR